MRHRDNTAKQISAFRAEAIRLIAESERYPISSPDWDWRRRAALTCNLWDMRVPVCDHERLLEEAQARGPLFTRAEREAMEIKHAC